MAKREFKNFKFPNTSVTDEFVKKNLSEYMKRTEGKTIRNLKKTKYVNVPSTFGKKKIPIKVDTWEFDD